MMDYIEAMIVERELEEDRYLEGLPTCEICGEKIQDEYYYDINNTIMCESCMNELHRKDNC